jgi:diacylglycerol O-acyltransferase
LNIDHPVWVEDKDFDVSRHLHRIALPSPGGRRELAEICGHIASRPLDRSKPVWEMWVIEGIAGTDPLDGGPLALMIKVHHAAVDGVSATNLLNQLCSLEPDSPPPEPVPGPGDATRLEIAAGGLVRFLTRPLQLARVVPATMSTIVNTIYRAHNGTAMAAPFAAPATVFNAEVTSERNVALAQLDLEDVKRVKDRFDVKVNDVVMALCAGALREFLRDRGELPDKPLVAVVPASVHDSSDRPGRNQVSGMFCNLQTHIEDPGERLRAIAESSSNAKEHSRALGPTLVVDWTQVVARSMFGVIMGLMAHSPLSRTPIHNVIISNVAGPPHTLYGFGAELKGLYPFGPIFHGSGLNVTVMSLNGKLNVGIISCRQLVDDLWDLADRFEKELGALLFSKVPVDA